MGHKPFGWGLARRRHRYAWAGWVLVAGVFLGLPALGITVLGLVHSQPNEVVAVKYRGKVECEDVTRSSFIRRVCYDRLNNYMLINLDGRYHRYCDIDDGTVASLLAAESMSEFYNSSIKGQFGCRGHRRADLLRPNRGG